MKPEILREHNSKTYIEASYRNINSYFNKSRNYPHYEFRDTPEISTMVCSIKHSMFNRVTKTSLKEENVEQKVEDTIQYFKKHDVPFTWQVNPWDKPPNLAQVLEQTGLKASFSPGMAIKLNNLKEPKTPKTYSIKMVNTIEERNQYAWLLVRAHGTPIEYHQTIVDIFDTIALTEDYQHYIGYLDGNPVSTTSILYDFGVAGIYNVATLPEARGKGMGSMITATSLLDAKKRGYGFSILHSTPIGYNVYKRLGYKEICKMNFWEWHP